MSTVIPNIIGPIAQGTSFVILTVINTIPNVLNLNENKIYYWESSLSKVKKLPLFYVFPDPAGLIITDSSNGGGLVLANSLLVNNNIPFPITIEQDLYAPWNPPDFLLARVAYSLSFQGIPGYISISATGGNPIPATNIYFLPTTTYFSCPAGQNATVVDDPGKAVLNWFCLANNAISVCSGIDTIDNGWTTLDECQAGAEFEYCPVGSQCGSKSCNGPCATIYDDCSYSGNSYQCVFNIEKYFKDVPWYQNYIAIGIIVGVSIFFILLVILLRRRSRNAQIKKREQARERRLELYREELSSDQQN